MRFLFAVSLLVFSSLSSAQDQWDVDTPLPAYKENEASQRILIRFTKPISLTQFAEKRVAFLNNSGFLTSPEAQFLIENHTEVVCALRFQRRPQVVLSGDVFVKELSYSTGLTIGESTKGQSNIKANIDATLRFNDRVFSSLVIMRSYIGEGGIDGLQYVRDMKITTRELRSCFGDHVEVYAVPMAVAGSNN